MSRPNFKFSLFFFIFFSSHSLTLGAGDSEASKKVTTGRHVRTVVTHTGKFGAESVRGRQAECAVLRWILSKRGILGGENFCHAAARRNWFTLKRVKRHAQAPAKEGACQNRKSPERHVFPSFLENFLGKISAWRTGERGGQPWGRTCFYRIRFSSYYRIIFKHLVQLALPIVFWMHHFIFSDVSRIAWRSFNIRLITGLFLLLSAQLIDLNILYNCCNLLTTWFHCHYFW